MRALSQLAAYGQERALTAKELARLTLVPSPYLSKILRRLVAAELLASQKGHGGGFVLARPAASIRISDILDAVDELPNEERCAFGWGDCDAAHPCPLHPAWSRLNDALRDWATSTTLQNVSGKIARR